MSPELAGGFFTCEPTGMVRMDIFVLLLLLEEKLSFFFTFKYDVSCELFIDVLYQVDEILWYS